MISKVTEWFPGDVKPARKGVYERELNAANRFSYWNGEKWMSSGFTPAEAMRHYGLVSDWQFKGWRGLASDPKKGTIQ